MKKKKPLLPHDYIFLWPGPKDHQLVECVPHSRRRSIIPRLGLAYLASRPWILAQVLLHKFLWLLLMSTNPLGTTEPLLDFSLPWIGFQTLVARIPSAAFQLTVDQVRPSPSALRITSFIVECWFYE
uniref:Uncharacterized protein n=1 Tax=Bionectria ochroleuca TaxID=29856 RepID=A0A8H7MYB7_BIOOC